MRIINGKLIYDLTQKDEDGIPRDFYCPISKMIIIDAVSTSEGTIHDRQYIEKEIERKTIHSLPLKDLVTNQMITTVLTAQPVVNQLIKRWFIENDRQHLIKTLFPKKIKKLEPIVRTAEEALTLIKNANALVRTINSEMNVEKDWAYNICQLKDPAHYRPIKALNPAADRTVIYDTLTGQYIKRDVHAERGHDQDTEFTKKMPTALLTTTGQMYVYQPDGVGYANLLSLIFDINLCKINPRFIFDKNSRSNEKWWILKNSNNTQLLLRLAVTPDVIRENNESSLLKGIIPNWNEIVPGLSRNALVAIGCHSEVLSSRLNAIHRREYLKQSLKADLPIVMLDPSKAVYAYEESNYVTDILEGLQSTHPVDRFFAYKSLTWINVDDVYATNLNDRQRGEILFYLIQDNQIDLAMHFLNNKALANLLPVPTTLGNSSLRLAIKNDHLQLFALTYQKYVDSISINSLEKLCLQTTITRLLGFAMHDSCMSILDFLITKIDNDFDVNIKSQVLTYLMERKRYQSALYLLKNYHVKVAYWHFDNFSNTPLHYAVQHNTPETAQIVKLLCKKGANPFETNKKNETPLEIAITNKNFYFLKVMLKSSFTTTHIPSHLASHLLFSLMEDRQYSLVKFILKKFKNIPGNISFGYISLLQQVVDNNQIKIARLLCQIKANPCQYESGKPPLMMAFENKQWELLRVLILESEYLQNNLGTWQSIYRDIFIYLIQMRDTKAVQAFIEKFSHARYLINMQDTAQNSVLHHALVMQPVEHDIIRLLCQRGARPHLKNQNNKTPLDLALAAKDYESLRIFLLHCTQHLFIDDQELLLDTLIQNKNLHVNLIIHIKNQELSILIIKKLIQAANTEQQLHSLWQTLSQLRKHHPNELAYFYRPSPSRFNLSYQESENHRWSCVHKLIKNRMLSIRIDEPENAIYPQQIKTEMFLSRSRTRWPQFFTTKSIRILNRAHHSKEEAKQLINDSNVKVLKQLKR